MLRHLLAISCILPATLAAQASIACDRTAAPTTPEGTTVTLVGITRFDQLPAVVTAPVDSPWTAAQFATRLQRGGTLALQNSTIDFGTQDSLALCTLALEKLILRGTTIITRGHTLRLFARDLDVDQTSRIIAFPNVNPYPTAASGDAGLSGRNGGLVRLALLGTVTGQVAINLSGENGQHGGPGVTGKAGARGASGRNGRNGPFGTCKRGPGNGKDGKRGGPGGDGGAAGNGGDGGLLEVAFINTTNAPTSWLSFTSNPGSAGQAGAAGEGGPGGAGGRRGGSAGNCGQNFKLNGKPGAQGPAGKAGAPGEAGERGSARVFAQQLP